MSTWDMTPADVARGRQVPDTDLPMLAAHWMAAGLDSPALVELACLTSRQPDEARRLLPAVLEELGQPVVDEPESAPTEAWDESIDDSAEWPTHPAFAAHFTDGLYTDESSEFAPFGTDEGWDLLASWADRVEELEGDPTVGHVLTDLADDPEQLLAGVRAGGSEAIEAAWLVVPAGFVLLRLTGRVDDRGTAAVLRAIEVLQVEYGPQEGLKQMSDDLESFRPRRSRRR